MIAARRAERLRLEKQIRRTFLVVLGEVALLLGLVSVMTARIIGAGVAINRLDSEMAKIKPINEKIAMYQASIKEMTPKLDLLANSKESTLLWMNIMRDFSHSMPNDTWLTSIQTTETAQTVQGDPKSVATPATPVKLVTLVGTSSSQSLVGETMLRLSGRPEFQRVDLNFTTKNASRDVDAVDFSLAAMIKPGQRAEGAEAGHVSN
jgi:Tfp pilus assembly protein PilN